MIIVTLTREMLTVPSGSRPSACDRGIALFDELVASQNELRARKGLPPRRGLRIRWSRLAQVWLASAGPWVWSWMRDNALLPEMSLRGANLVGANLDGANLVGANLVGANLVGWERGPDGYARRKGS